MRNQQALLFALQSWTLFSAIHSFSFIPSTNTLSQELRRPNTFRAKCSLHMAMTPVGPFSPFRSIATVQFDSRVDEMKAYTDGDFATEMIRMQQDIGMGKEPDPGQMMKAADGLDAAREIWESLITRLRISQDFQTREYGKLILAHLASHGVTIESMGSMAKWSSECMRAMAKNTMPPMPPRDLDLSKMMENANNENNSAPSLTAMAQAEPIACSPFQGNEEVFNSPQVKEEYEKLWQDHKRLIEFGAKYDTFDPAGKLKFVDEIDSVEERWEVFFARFSLMGKLNKEYVRQCNEFLGSMGMDEEKFRKLHRKSHQMMRDDAQAEWNRSGLR